jgi:AraC family transcriptional regulator
MPVSESYGDAFGKRLNARATSFLTRALPKSTIAVTELRYEDPQFILSTPPIEENAFVVAVHLELFERYEYWQDGKAAPSLHLGLGKRSSTMSGASRHFT